jgi:hypothetical protein
MKTASLIPNEIIENQIYLLRNQKVMLDFQLAKLYDVPTRRLKEQVRRNRNRFPDDFMFELDEDELRDWRSQFATSNSIKMGLRYSPMAFTEQGVAMLSSVLHNDRAILVNIAIMRAFVKLREMISTNKELSTKLEELERKFEKHDKEIITIFKAIRQIMEPPEKKTKKLGFIVEEKKRYYLSKI